ncbi:class I SAM-dependent methyltransferase [Infirmifilum lucidum]|uniref:Class I SAM-dependent methyltransferase n=1 Tax=Infirmifilum lucidum TaxID=2776706 RepID=A0A7L9FHY4_9CREN|nr:class I SAM-dependent methyltransferase [Infirmifilum lucidum]QOJ79369.1 class I SAM-dependent methyltransferase [Infirmifilum lucidum]
MSEEVIRVFSENAEAYDSWYRTDAGKVVLEAEAKLLETYLPEGTGIDVGAGTGVFAEKLSRNREIVCLDPSESMLRLARERCMHSIVGVGEYPPLRSRSVDFAYMVTVVEFLEDPSSIFKAIGSLLKEKGVLVVLSIERESPWGRLYMRLAAERADPVLSKARFYTRREVEEILLASGFAVRGRASTLDYEPLTVPEGEPRRYIEEECSECGVFLIACEQAPRTPCKPA